MARTVKIEYPVSIPKYFIGFVDGKTNEEMEKLYRENFKWKGKLNFPKEEMALTLRSLIFWWVVLRNSFKYKLSKIKNENEKIYFLVKKLHENLK